MIEEFCEWTGYPVDMWEGQCCWPDSSFPFLEWEVLSEETEQPQRIAVIDEGTCEFR